MLHVPVGANTFGLTEQVTTTAPAAAFGVTVTPASGSKGSWAQLLASTSNDAFGILININSNNTSAASRNTLLDIGIGGAGSEVVLIPNLICGNAAAYNANGGGVFYYFPIFIPAGSRVAARAASTVTTSLRCTAWLMELPAAPAGIRKASFVEAIGITTATAGTALAAPTTSLSSWTSVGTTTNRLWWWQIGAQVTTADTSHVAAAIQYDVAVGDGTTFDIIIKDLQITTTTTEQTANPPLSAGVEYPVPAGSSIYVRTRASAGADVPNVCVYGAGG